MLAVVRALVNGKALQQRLQLDARELPLKRMELLVGKGFVQMQPFLDRIESGKLVGHEHFALAAREIDLAYWSNSNPIGSPRANRT